MSVIFIAVLNASAEIPGMPPGIASERALADMDEALVPAQSDSALADLSDADPALPDPAESETIGGSPAPENPAPSADQTAFFIDVQAPGSDPDLWLYRDRTVALLRRYMRLSIEVGRMPSLLGREFFRARVTSYKASTFEDSVIFVHDVERSLEELNEFEKKLIAKIVLQQYSKEEAGRLLGCGYRTVERLFPETLDRVSEILLKREILTRLPETKREVPKTCQEGKTGPFLASD
jgi:DNA-directed RNA polymerase specialized sigma24 family protein